MRTERGELTELDRQVAKSLEQNEIVSQNVEKEYGEERTLGERLSDRLASFGGSWTFLIAFFAVLLIWIAINVAWAQRGAFDPFPVHPPEPGALVPCGHPGADHHDEPASDRNPRTGCGR